MKHNVKADFFQKAIYIATLNRTNKSTTDLVVNKTPNIEALTGGTKDQECHINIHCSQNQINREKTTLLISHKS